MREQEKKQQRIYDSLNAETKPKKKKIPLSLGFFLMASIKPTPKFPWLAYMAPSRKQQKCNFPCKY